MRMARFFRLSGLIPACAGKTIASAERDLSRGAHPRMRGENGAHMLKPGAYSGSSPHARGKLTFSATNVLGCRAHPRMRGENIVVCICQSLRLGSSPHARGKPVVHPGGFMGHGLIPACAGKTTLSTTGASLRSAHPRMRGENDHQRRLGSARAGSSPHARGKRIPALSLTRRIRLIPACAGKTSC